MLHDNQLTGVIPSWFENLHSLTRLFVSMFCKTLLCFSPPVSQDPWRKLLFGFSNRQYQENCRTIPPTRGRRGKELSKVGVLAVFMKKKYPLSFFQQRKSPCQLQQEITPAV